MLFVHLSSACLASSSIPLRTYVFFPNNYLSLASLSKPNSLTCRVLITFHILPEQSLRFKRLCLFHIQVRLPFRHVPIMSLWWGRKESNLQVFVTYFDVLLLLLRILLETKYNTPTVFQLAAYQTVFQVSGQLPFYSQTGTMPFLARSDSVPTYQHSVFISLAVLCAGANLLNSSPLAWSLSLRTKYLTYYLPPFDGRSLSGLLRLAQLDHCWRKFIGNLALAVLLQLPLSWTLYRPYNSIFKELKQHCVVLLCYVLIIT